MTYMELARRLRRWTQAQLGDRVQITQHTISYIELGKWKATPDEIQRIADVLDLPAALVVRDVDHPRQLHAQLRLEKAEARVAALEAEVAAAQQEEVEAAS